MVSNGKLSDKQRDLIRKKSKESFYFFARFVLNYNWLVPHIHKPLCDRLQNPDNNRLRIVLPRGWLKSTICSIAYPIWCAINNPDIRVLIAQNTHTNACKKLGAVRSHFEDNILFRTLFPELLPKSRSKGWRTESLTINRPGVGLDAGTFEAAGTATQVISRHYDLIIEDDTVAPDLDELTEENVSPTQLDVEQAIGWHRGAVDLLIDYKKSQIIVVGTRWFEVDLLSWIDDNEPNYMSYTRACRELEDGSPSPEGEVTYPERFDDEVLTGLEQSKGPYMFSCLYLNQPLRSSDMTFKPEWFEYYETEPRDIITYTTVDPAGDPEMTKTKPDWNVIMTCGKDLTTGRIFVLDFIRKRCNPSELITDIFYTVRKWHPVRVGIEAVAYQQSLIYHVKERARKEKLYFHIDPITHGRRSKATRIQGLQPIIHAGDLLFRKHHGDLVNELLAFPLGAHDDMADALSMQLGMWKLTKTKKEVKEQKIPNPFSLEAELQWHRDRSKVSPGSVQEIFQSVA